MPTYEYRCKDCGASLEVVQSFSDPSLTECRTCGGRLRKVFGNVGISFKGSGFYRTDSRSGSSTEAKESPAKDSAGAKESTNGSDKGSTGSKTSEKTEKKSGTDSSGTKKSEAKSSK